MAPDAPPLGPHPPSPPGKGECCLWSARLDALNLLYGRLSFEGELTVWGPFAIGLEPAWIWGSQERNLDESGFGINGDVAIYLEENPMNGLRVKAHGGYEYFLATITHPGGPTDSKPVSTGRIGLSVGGALVVSPKQGGGGFIIDGGFGFTVATAEAVTLSTAADFDPSQGVVRRAEHVYFSGWRRVTPLASMAVGVAF